MERITHVLLVAIPITFVVGCLDLVGVALPWPITLTAQASCVLSIMGLVYLILEKLTGRK